MHTHTRVDETSYLLDRAITADAGGEKVEVEAVQDLARRAQSRPGCTLRSESRGCRNRPR